MISTPHGGDLNGFIVIAGDPAKLDTLARSDQLVEHVTRADINLSGFGAVRASTGDAALDLVKIWAKHI